MPLRKKTSAPGESVFFISPQTRSTPKENAYCYDRTASGQSIYNYFRDYEPGTGRYVEADPIGLAGGLNIYSYAGGNPISNIDPEGKNTIALGAGGGALIAGPPGAVVGAVIGGVVLVGAVAYEMCKDDDDDCRKDCDDQLERDEAECLVAKAGYGKAVQRICLAKAKEYYSQCLRKCDGK